MEKGRRFTAKKKKMATNNQKKNNELQKLFLWKNEDKLLDYRQAKMQVEINRKNCYILCILEN